MDLLATIALRAAFLCACVVLPGWALVRLIGFRSRSRADVLLATLTIGSAYVAQAVTVLLLTRIYTRPTAVVVLIAPIALLLWRRPKAPPELTRQPYPANDRSAVDRAVLTAVALFLCVYLIDAASSPMTMWDGLATWGKWAPDWGRRIHSGDYLVGGYPQLVPRIISILYKLTASHSEILPLDFFAAHVFYTLFAAWFVLAATRLSDLLELPAWPAVLAGVGSLLFRRHIGGGTVDVLLTAQVLTLIALYFGWAKGIWSSSIDPAWVIATATFATLFTKLTGILGPLLLLSLHPAVQRRFPGASWRTVRVGLLTGLLFLLPFVVEQGYTELRVAHFRPDPFEANLSVRHTPALLATEAEITYRGGGLASRPQLVQLRFWNSYDVPVTLRLAFSLFLLGCLGVSVRNWVARAMLPVLVAYCLMWSLWSSYDLRNVFVATPLLAIVAAYGATVAWAQRPRLLLQSVIATFAGLFLVLAGGGLLKDLQARGKSLSGAGGLYPRLTAIRGGPDPRIQFFFPDDAADYLHVRALAERTGARHVLASSPIYRFFKNGVYTMNLWPTGRVQAGDLFVSHHDWHRPPDETGWVFVYRGKSHRVWVFDPDVSEAMAHSRRPTDRATSRPPGVVELDIEGDELVRRGYVLWEAEVTTTGTPSEVRYIASGVRLAPVSTIARESVEGGVTRVAGVIAGELDDGAPAALVTIVIPLDPAQDIRRFRTSARIQMRR